MNVFDELIQELKEDNLLEREKPEVGDFPEYSVAYNDNSEKFSVDESFADEVIYDEEVLDLQTNQANHGADKIDTDDLEITEDFQIKDFQIKEELIENGEIENESEKNSDVGLLNQRSADEISDFNEENTESLEAEEKNEAFFDENQVGKLENPELEEKEFIFNNSGDFAADEAQNEFLGNESAYFRKRAIEEVSFLQMVEGIFSGVERQQMKIVPKPYNEIPVKKALHSFLQISENVNSPEHAQSEFQLLQETESWYSALSHRDKHISVANLRLYCETSKPALSSPALVALARFYRNLPYSESARNKFDLIVTRLFSKDIESNKRAMLFERDELIGHFKALYNEWESITIYSDDEDDSDILLTALKFEEFRTEAEEADSFDELILSDFFNRLRVFKKGINENFFAPLISATAVESNIGIGNRYVGLLEAEREKENAANLEEKYGFLHDQTISDVTSKTLQLVELLKEKKVQKQEKLEEEDSKKLQTAVAADEIKEIQTETAKPQVSGDGKILGANKWLVFATIIIIVAGLAFYNFSTAKSVAVLENPDVKAVNLENSSLNNFIQKARINKDTFYAVTLSSWDSITKDQKEELLKKILIVGNEKGFDKVLLINQKGKSAGYASSDKIEVYIR